MGYELIITEKPQAAKKIAEALANGKPIKRNLAGVPYYEITHGSKDIVVGCAVGHLFTMGEKNKGKWAYPVFDVEWKPISEVQKASKFSAKYASALKKLCKDANEFTIACDYDIEGEVIGYNVLRFICKQKDGRRMKFSALTKEDLSNAYSNASPTIDWAQAKAGLTRHELDWYYGINLSRALTIAVKNAGAFKILSSGRVQGPALKIITDKEKEIQAFSPVPFWQIELIGEVNKEGIVAWHIQDKFMEKDEALQAFKKAEGHSGKIISIDRKQFKQKPPFPFDLTTLQTEAYRTLGIQPKNTLDIAQELYVNGYISYPRTSSQRLPSVNYRKIIGDLGKQPEYKELALKLNSKHSLSPSEGAKTDPAHPAIYPTGARPALTDRKKSVYDLIVRRFLACFADSAVRETVVIKMDVNSEIFVSKGTRTLEKGWHEFYGRFVPFQEQELPECKEGDIVKQKDLKMHDCQTQPPKRYTPASIIRELEKRNLGTKATRAAIVENLYQRGYIDGVPIQATPLGINTCEILEKFSPKIVDEKLTRHFEEEMEKIRDKSSTPEDILNEAKSTLTDILNDFKKHEKEVGEGLLKANIETRNSQSQIGSCPICKDGILEIRQGKFGRFIACNKYPECSTTLNLPNSGKIKITQDTCKHCSFPMIQMFRGKSKPQIVCVNNKCPSKKSLERKEVEQETKQKAIVDKKCPRCGAPLLLRRSIYGEFLGCSKFPKCRHTEKIAHDSFSKS